MKRYYFTFMHLNNKIGAKASLTKIWGIGHQRVKNLPAMQETWVQSLDQEDSLEKGVKTHSSIFAWRIPQTEATVHGVTESDMTERLTHIHTHTFSLWFATKQAPSIQVRNY